MIQLINKSALTYFGFILLILISSCNNKTDRKDQAITGKDVAVSKKDQIIYNKPENQNRPERKNDENLKLICFWSTIDHRKSKFKVKHIGEKLIDITDNVLHRGDSISYSFNLKDQLVKTEVYTNEGQLKDRTSFEYNSLRQLEKISSRNFDGGSPMTIRYIYNTLNQIIEQRGLSENSYERFTYDARNYLIQKEQLDNNHILIQTTRYSYDNPGNLISILTQSNAGETISVNSFKYNEFSQAIEREHWGEPINCAGRNKWYIKYNQFGDKIEAATHDLTVHHKYEYDNNNNWTKQYSYYDNDENPNFLTTRTIEYF